MAVLTCSDAIEGRSYIIGIVGSPSPNRKMFGHRLLGVFGLARVGWEDPKDWERGEGGCWASAHLLLQSLYLSHQMLLLLFLKNPRGNKGFLSGLFCPHIALLPLLGT